MTWVVTNITRSDSLVTFDDDCDDITPWARLPVCVSNLLQIFTSSCEPHRDSCVLRLHVGLNNGKYKSSFSQQIIVLIVPNLPSLMSEAIVLIITLLSPGNTFPVSPSLPPLFPAL